MTPHSYIPSAPTPMAPPPPRFSFNSPMSSYQAGLMKRAKTLEEFKSSPPVDESDDDRLKRFLGYRCNFKKHKGRTWLEVFESDYNYFCWAVKTRLKPESKTYQTLFPLTD